MRLEFYAKVARRRMRNDYLEYIAIPKEIRGGVSLYGKTVHVIIETIDDEGKENEEEESQS